MLNIKSPSPFGTHTYTALSHSLVLRTDLRIISDANFAESDNKSCVERNEQIILDR